MKKHLLLASLFLVACPANNSTDVANIDATIIDVTTAQEAASPMEANAPDVESTEASSDEGTLASDSAMRAEQASCPPMPPAPTGMLRPQRGELFYAQLALGGLQLGESALLVGPDGTRVLIDVGNNSHDDDIARQTQQWLGDTNIDHVVITHFHADHGDGLGDLLTRLTLRGRVVHRGFTDMTAAANEGTMNIVCTAAQMRSVGLCTTGRSLPCNPTQWGGQQPATSCPGLETADLSLGDGAILDFVAANGTIGTESFERSVRPLLMTDSNGENARSVVAVLRHGAFRMLVAGDLTGGGSSTDAVEGFYAARLVLGGEERLGVDVLHAGHHGRNTSSSQAWVDRLLPIDGRTRNAVMGISTAHLRSPHAETISALLDNNRLAEGKAWTTTVAIGGVSNANLIDANGGQIVVSTLQNGAFYAVQAIGSNGMVLRSSVYRSVRSCP